MASENPSLGLLSKLPCEIRKQIWEEFAPTDQYRHPLMTERQKTDLSILRASWALYDEISEILYKDSCLIFSLRPVYRGSEPWAKATFKYQERQNYLNKRPTDPQPTWSLANLADARCRGFYSLPFHKIETVIVNLHAPDPEKTAEIFFLWRNVTDLVDLFREATTIRDLTIRDLTIWLQKGTNGDWFQKRLGPNASAYFQIKNRRCDHDVVFLPFCTLRNVDNIDIETHSKELEAEIDWTIINRGMNTVWDHSWEHLPSFGDYKISGHDVDRAVAADYFSMHIDLWLRPEEPEADLARRDVLSTWFIQGSTGDSQFENRVLQIIKDYPEIIQAYDPQMEILDEMHTILISVYHHARTLYGKLEDPESWDQEVWKSILPEGIPADYTSEYWSKFRPKFVDDDIYADYKGKENFLSNMSYIIRKWKSEHPADEDEDEDDLSLSLYVSCERCPDYDSELDELGYYDWLR